jgi:hypothetical protein
MIDSTFTYAFVDFNELERVIHGHEVVNRSGWQGVTTYYRYDGVTYGGDDYISLAPNSNTPPGTDTALWALLVTMDGTETSPYGTDAYARALAQEALDIAVAGTNMTIAETGSRVAADLYLTSLIGSLAGSITADTVPYGRNTFATVGDALDSLFYVSPSVTSFTNDVGTIETGGSISVVSLAWAFNKSISSQSINQGIGSLPAAQRSFAVSGAFTSSTTFTLSAQDDHATSCNGNTTVSFMQKRYWGVSSNSSLNDAQIIALNSEFSSSRSQTRTMAPSAQYLYFAYPASFGAATFTVNGLPNTDWTLIQRSFVNASGYSESYRIYRSNNMLTGNYQIAVS